METKLSDFNDESLGKSNLNAPPGKVGPGPFKLTFTEESSPIRRHRMCIYFGVLDVSAICCGKNSIHCGIACIAAMASSRLRKPIILRVPSSGRNAQGYNSEG